MKTIARFIIRVMFFLIDAIILFPIILVGTEGPSFIPNIIGLAWFGLVAYTSQTKLGEEWLDLNNKVFWHFLDEPGKTIKD